MFNSPVPSKWAAPSFLRLLLGLLGFCGFLGFLGFVPFLGLAGQDKGGILGQRRGGDPQSISAISINQLNPNSPVMRSSFVETGRILRGFGAGVSLGENLLEALDLDGPDVPGQGDGLGLERGLDIDGIRVPSVDLAWAASGKVSARVGFVVIRPVEGARGTGRLQTGGLGACLDPSACLAACGRLLSTPGGAGIGPGRGCSSAVWELCNASGAVGSLVGGQYRGGNGQQGRQLSKFGDVHFDRFSKADSNLGKKKPLRGEGSTYEEAHFGNFQTDLKSLVESRIAGTLLLLETYLI